jgi:hypothetical protein
LVGLTVGALIVVAATAIMAPRLATDRSVDARLTAELDGLHSSGYLDGIQDLGVVEIDSSAPEPTRQATVGKLSGTTPMEVGSFTKARLERVTARSSNPYGNQAEDRAENHRLHRDSRAAAPPRSNHRAGRSSRPEDIGRSYLAAAGAGGLGAGCLLR